MSGRIPREFIDELLVRVDIVDLIDSHVPLKKTGSNYVARCPFHTEKTPSFSVNRNKQFFHCFGCGVSGNAISFLMDFNHLDFVEAVEDLAAFVGVDVPREASDYKAGQKKDNLSSLYTTLEQVAAFYMEQLRVNPEGKKAVEYLKTRGVNSEVARDFMLGYAPNHWKGLIDQFGHELLIAGGLLGHNDDGKVYARFRGRIMFPIRDKRARVVGFGGRVVDNSLPKYLNSPETPLFYKAREVYGLYELLQKNAKPARILIVEGYMDVIALAQFGIDYAVAALGTAVSLAHLDLLFRFSQELVLCFDGDKAGRSAAWRAMEPAFSSIKDGRSCRIMLLPQNHDPDSLVREEGLDRFSERVQSAQALSDYFFEYFSEKLNLSEIEGRAQLVSKAKAYLEKLPAGVFREMMFEELSRLARLHVTDNKPILGARQKLRGQQQNAQLSLPKFVVTLLLQNPELVVNIEQKKIDWQGLEFPGVAQFQAILQVILDKKPANTAVLLEFYRGHANEKTVKDLVSLDLQILDNQIKNKVFCDALDNLLKQGREAGIARLQVKAQGEGLDRREKELLLKLLAGK